MVKSKIIALVLACVAVLSVTCYAAVDPDAYWFQNDDGTYAYDQIAFDHDRAADMIYRSGFNLNADNYYVIDYSTGNIVGYDYEAFTRDYNALLPPVEPSEPEDEPEILPEPSEPDFAPLEPVEPEDELLDCLEPIDTEITDPEGNLVVDISENSIQAIADAVTMSNSSISITNSEGVSFTLTGPIIAEWENYDKHILVHYGSSIQYMAIYMFNDADVVIDGNTMTISRATGVYSNFSSPASPRDGITYTFSYGPWDMSSHNINPIISVLYNDIDIENGDGEVDIPSDTHIPVISFDTGFDDYTIPSMELTDFVLPNPSKAGYSFLGWYLDADLTELYTSAYQFTSDTTLYAKWEEAPPMVSFHQAIFQSFDTLFSSEPFVYITALFALLVVIGSIKLLMYKNL